ncbi:MAG TPA: ATP-binding protein [Crocinitomicaceae bacterium]|nr:ATP-binding protein [Crocinitomicaceae bacterium]
MIARITIENIDKKLFKGKAILLFGARQVGKTTLLEYLIKYREEEVLHLNGDEPDIREVYSNVTSTQLRAYIGNNKILFIDEAQRIPNIGLTIKLITDKLKDIQVIATGSSSFEMANKMNEPLTGRKFVFNLFPLSFQEMVDHHGLLEEKRSLEQRLIYGSYPEIVSYPEDSEELLKLLADSYLYKDLLMLDNIKRPKLLEKILQALALQVGNEVSYNEIAQLVGADKGTVEKYIQLFEQTFVIFTLPSYSRNVRNELKKSKKIYFYDCGIRNAIIGNFNSLYKRSDIGALWENYLISERIKKMHYKGDSVSSYFWRTTQQQEIDFVEVGQNGIHAYEFKWNDKVKVKFSKTFTNNYPEAKVEVISTKNYENFLL